MVAVFSLVVGVLHRNIVVVMDGVVVMRMVVISDIVVAVGGFVVVAMDGFIVGGVFLKTSVEAHGPDDGVFVVKDFESAGVGELQGVAAHLTGCPNGSGVRVGEILDEVAVALEDEELVELGLVTVKFAGDANGRRASLKHNVAVPLVHQVVLFVGRGHDGSSHEEGVGLDHLAGQGVGVPRLVGVLISLAAPLGVPVGVAHQVAVTLHQQSVHA